MASKWVGNLLSEPLQSQVKAELGSRGVYFIPDAIEAAECHRIRAWIDSQDGLPDIEVNYGGSEIRVWDAEKKNPDIADFIEGCDKVMSWLVASEVRAHTALAIRNRPVSIADRSLISGRWHTDSFRRQYKIFLFLSDVTTDTGPFEFLPATHRWPFKLRMVCKGVYFRLRDAWRGTRGYARIDDSVIDSLLRRGYVESAATCKAGTIMVVDTTAIHRARPCLVGERYAVSSYYR